VTEDLNTFNAQPSACPFVAFEDDRDHRSDVPDYRHRCFASAEPEPKAFPHQERYCLSDGFTECPVFRDWARQEAAGVARLAASRQAGGAVADEEEAPAFLSSRSRTSDPVDAGAASRRTADASAGLWSTEGNSRRNSPSAPPAPSSLAAPSVAMARRGPSHPGWENPPRLDNFPRLRSRDEGHSNQPLLIATAAVAVLMVALVLVPFLLGNHGGGPGPSGASSSPNASESQVAVVDSPSPSESPQAGPTFKLITVQSEPNLTAVAAEYNVTIAQIVAANKGTAYEIANPDIIWKGMQLLIPPPGWTAPPATPTPVPTASVPAS
jgi:hypothetical protein